VLLEAGAVLIEHAEIMVRELQVEFGLDAVALHLAVARELAVFLQQLSGIAALTIVLAIARIGTAVRRASPAATAATAAALTIVDQMKILVKKGLLSPSHWLAAPSRKLLNRDPAEPALNQRPQGPRSLLSGRLPPVEAACARHRRRCDEAIGVERRPAPQFLEPQYISSGVVGPVPEPLSSDQRSEIQVQKRNHGLAPQHQTTCYVPKVLP
jgi:hypothetical protein